MDKLLLITGDLATGKTTLSRRLGTREGAVVFQKDTIKEILGDHIVFHNREENKALSVATVALMTHIFSQLGGRGVGMILEANFSESELSALHELASERGTQVLTLVLRADLDLLYERYLHRITCENRHPVHLSAPLHLREEFDRYILAARVGTIPGETIEINANDFAYQTDEELLGRIDAFFQSDGTTEDKR